MAQETILVVGAHADDAEISMGGTIVFFSRQGKRLINVIASSGEASSPGLRKDVLVAQRKAEVLSIEKVIGFSATHFLEMPDGKVSLLASEKKYQQTLADLIATYKPKKIFTHRVDDPHKDHQGAHALVMSTLKRVDPKKKVEVYTFEVWNITNETRPGMYVDISSTFAVKLRAIRLFRSQWLSVYLLFIPIWYRAFICGLHNGCKYAERFYKVR